MSVMVSMSANVSDVLQAVHVLHVPHDMAVLSVLHSVIVLRVLSCLCATHATHAFMSACVLCALQLLLNIHVLVARLVRHALHGLLVFRGPPARRVVHAARAIHVSLMLHIHVIAMLITPMFSMLCTCTMVRTHCIVFVLCTVAHQPC